MTLLLFAALASSISLSPDLQEIATKVAGRGKPDCTSYVVDGSSGPCLPWFEVIPGTRINAWSNGSTIAFSQAATMTVTRDEFALLAGHEIAHYYLGHTRKSNPADELEADRFGAQLACNAGFDPVAGMSLVRHLRSGITHPRQAERRAVILAVRCVHPMSYGLRAYSSNQVREDRLWMWAT